MSDQWSKIQHIEKGVEIIPLRDRSLCDEWVLREEADQRIAALEARLDAVNEHYPIARSGEQQFACVLRNRSGIDSGRIDFGALFIDELSEGDQQDAINSAFAIYEKWKRETGKRAKRDNHAERIAELEAERNDYKDRWEQTGCTRHGAMEAAIKVKEELLEQIAELEAENKRLIAEARVMFINKDERIAELDAAKINLIDLQQRAADRTNADAQYIEALQARNEELEAQVNYKNEFDALCARFVEAHERIATLEAENKDLKHSIKLMLTLQARLDAVADIDVDPYAMDEWSEGWNACARKVKAALEKTDE